MYGISTYIWLIFMVHVGIWILYMDAMGMYINTNQYSSKHSDLDRPMDFPQFTQDKKNGSLVALLSRCGFIKETVENSKTAGFLDLTEYRKELPSNKNSCYPKNRTWLINLACQILLDS